ncbi:MAG TPA: acyltransferase family protein [Gaiellaceae bacterium]|nr:acyltransferase family protein [Gaiellaceae bacterium]
MKHEKRLDIQGLRALAILFVLAYHGHLGLGTGFVGVDVFFAISGFVITGVLLRELTRDGSLSLSGFYTRRVKRILPALAAMVTLVVALGIYLAPIGALHITSLTAVAAAVFGANWYAANLPDGYFAVSSTADPLLHTWSLGVEEQFYVFYPVVLLGGWLLGRRIRAPREAAIGLVAVVTVVSFILAGWWWAHDATVAFYASPTRAWEFGAGALTALLAPTWSRLTSVQASTLAVVAIPVLIVSAFVVSSSGGPVWLAMPVLATCVLMAAGTSTNPVSRLLELQPLVAVGDLSYSLYLWHWPLIVFAHALFPVSGWAVPVTAVFSVAPAVASYRLIENPIRRGHFRGRRVVAIAAACVVLPAGAALATLPASLLATGPYKLAGHEDTARGCDSALPFGSPERERCAFTVARPKGTVVLIGDSNAGHFTEPVVRAGNSLGFDVDVVTMSSCPFVLVQLSANHTDGSSCERHNSRSLTALNHARPSLVIVSNRADAWIEEAGNRLGSPLSNDPRQKTRLYGNALRREVDALVARHIPVEVVHPVPLLPLDESGCASILLLSENCSGSVAREVVDSELARTLAAERSALRDLPSTWLLDLEDRICSRSTCYAKRNGVLMYRNENHLSVPGSLTLTSSFAAAIRAHARRGS